VTPGTPSGAPTTQQETDKKSVQEDIIRRMVANMAESSDEPKKLPLGIQARNLLDIRKEMLRSNPFNPGDLVTQRFNAARYRWPTPKTEVALVTQVGAAGEFGERSDHTYGREDMIILCLVDGTWVEYSVESWRFDRYDGDIE